MTKRQLTWFISQGQNELPRIESRRVLLSQKNVLPIWLLHFRCASQRVSIHCSIHPTANQVHNWSTRLQLLLTFSFPFVKDNWLCETTKKQQFFRLYDRTVKWVLIGRTYVCNFTNLSKQPPQIGLKRSSAGPAEVTLSLPQHNAIKAAWERVKNITCQATHTQPTEMYQTCLPFLGMSHVAFKPKRAPSMSDGWTTTWNVCCSHFNSSKAVGFILKTEKLSFGYKEVLKSM